MDTVPDLCALCGEQASVCERPSRRLVCRDHLCPGFGCAACVAGPCAGRCPICRSLATPPYVLKTAPAQEPPLSRERREALLAMTPLGCAVLASETAGAGDYVPHPPAAPAAAPAAPAGRPRGRKYAAVFPQAYTKIYRHWENNAIGERFSAAYVLAALHELGLRDLSRAGLDRYLKDFPNLPRLSPPSRRHS